MVQTLTNSSQDTQHTARSIKTEFGPVSLIPEKFCKTTFDLRLNGRMWFGTIEQNSCGWGCLSNDEIISEESLEVLVANVLEAYIKNASVTCPNFRSRLLAA